MSGASASRLDREALEAFAVVEDPLGVLSVYVDADPTVQATTTPPWAVEVDNALSDLRRDARERGPRELWVALDERIAEIQGEIDRIADASRPGRGRALFATLSEPRMRSLSLQVPLATRVVLEPRAYVRPLVCALDRWRPMGVATVSADGVGLHDLRLGEAVELGWTPFSEATDDWREKKGPAGANPAYAQQTAPQRDRFDRRMDANRARFLTSFAGTVAATAASHGWDQLIVAGDPRLTGTLIGSLPAGSVEAHAVERLLVGMSAHEVADALAEDIAGLQERRLADLVERARQGTLAGGRGALGLAATRAALGEGRVEHLLLADGTHDDGRGEAARLGERMIERALATGAEVTPVDGPAAAALDAHEGVGALLRW